MGHNLDSIAKTAIAQFWCEQPDNRKIWPFKCDSKLLINYCIMKKMKIQHFCVTIVRNECKAKEKNN